MYKYVKEFGCVINTEEPLPDKNSPRLHTQQPSIQYTIDAIEMAGGAKVVANEFKLSSNAVRYWMTLSEWGVSASWAVELSKLTNDKITPLELRPDVFKGYTNENK